MTDKLETLTIHVTLKPGVDKAKWKQCLTDMIGYSHMEDPDTEIEERSYVIEGIEAYAV